jgi:hypothetical protein
MRMPLAWTRKPGPHSLPGLSPLDEFYRETVLVKRRGRAQACHATADDQYRFELCHMRSNRVALDRHCAGSEGTSPIGNRRS